MNKLTDHSVHEAKKAPKQKSSFWIKGKMDITFLALVLILLGVGLVMLFSASYAYAHELYGNSYRFIIRQAAFAVGGVIAMLFVSKIDYRILRNWAWIIYGISVAMLVIVLILPPLREGFDYKRWIAIGGFSFQPSEIAKFAVVILFAQLITKYQNRMQTFKFGILQLGGLLMLVCGLVVVETHLSATLLIFSMGIMLMVVGGIKRRYILIGGGSVFGLGAIAIITGIVSYGSSRIQYWLDPWAAPTGEGYQTIQSLLSIGSGGLMGKGLGQSRQKYLWPEPHNDFIFSIVSEELGYIGAMVIIILFALLVWRGFVIVMRCPDRFGSLTALGLIFQVGIQTALNIMVVTNTIPNTGISLPFFSYGGTALLILLVEMGVILSISRSSKMQKT